MIAVQVFVDGRPGPVVRALDAALIHAADAVLGARGDADRLAAGLASLAARHARLAEAGIPCGLGHMLRLAAEADGGPGIALAWHDLDAGPGAPGVILRHDFEEGPDPGYLLFEALAGVEDEADLAYLSGEVGRRCALAARPAPGEGARARLDRLRRVQALFAPGAGNPLALVPGEPAGDPSAVLAGLARRASGAFDALAPSLVGPRAFAA